MGIRIVQVDAFTDRPFRGNPAAVCVLREAKPEEWLRDVAREMNLSETAFLWEREDGYQLRWLTPAAEVDLCGHATLASAHVLWEDWHLAAGRQARFHTRSGPLTADRRGAWIEMNFPSKAAQAAEPPAALLPSLGLERAAFVGRNAFDYLVEVESEEALRRVAPDFTALRKVDVRGVMVTARGEGEFDFVSRFFAPAVGVDEDPVTGSAHTALAPYWGAKLGKCEMTAYQASARGGVLRLRLEGERVILGGQAVTVMTGELVG